MGLDTQLERQNLFCINELPAEKKYAKDYVFHTTSHLKQNKLKKKQLTTHLSHKYIKAISTIGRNILPSPPLHATLCTHSL